MNDGRDNESRKWLYDQMTKKGYNVGKDYAEFDSLMENNEESRKWLFGEAQKMGWNVGKDYDEFNSLVGPQGQEAAGGDGVAADGTKGTEGGGTGTEGQRSREAKRPTVGGTVLERTGYRPGWSKPTAGNAGANASQGSVSDPAEGQPVADEAQDGGAGEPQPEEAAGEPLGPERFAQAMEMQQQVGAMKSQAADMEQDFARRMEAVRKQGEPFRRDGDVLEPVRNELRRRETDKEIEEGLNLATMGMRQDRSAVDATWYDALGKAKEQWRFGRVTSNEAARLKETDLDKLMDEAWQRMDPELKEGTIKKVANVLAEYGMRRDEARATAERVARGESDRMMYERAVEGNMPRNVLEHILNKVNENSVGKLLEGVARAKAGTIGDMQARDEASLLYGKTHRVADIIGGVASVGLDVGTTLAGGFGGGAAKGAVAVLGRKAAATAAGKVATGMAAGAANLAAFEAIGEATSQAKYGGELKVDEETGRYVVDDFSAGNILKSAGRGALLGMATGATGALVGNVFDKAYEGVKSTAGKLGVRSGQVLTSIAAEGTVFSAPEFLKGEGDWDTWLESVEMMAGFKVSAGLKSARSTYEKLKKNPESRAGFETRLRTMLDGEPSLALTKDEKAELEENGYADLAALVEGYKQTSKSQREAIEKHQPIYLEPNEQGEVPYNRFVELMGDKSISEATRAKMHYYATGHKLPQSTIIGTTFTEHTDADGRVTGYTVEAFGTDGSTIVSRNYKSLREAEAARDRYNRQAELNGLKVAEGVHDQVHEKMEDGVTAERVRKGVNEEYGVDIDKALGKEPNRRSEGERRAIEEYLRRLAGNEKKEVSLPPERQLQDGPQASDTENDSELGVRPDTPENQPSQAGGGDGGSSSATRRDGEGVRHEVSEERQGGGGRGHTGGKEERLAPELHGDYERGSYAEQQAYGLRVIERAKEQGLYIDPATLGGYGDRYKRGSGESIVYLDKANNRVVKVKDPFAKAPMKGNATDDALYEHLVHNLLFPESEYRLLGVTEVNGAMRLVLEQDYVEGSRKATKEEVERYLTEELGLQKEGKYWYGNDWLSVTDIDATSDNVIVDSEGGLHFIDPIIKLKASAKEVLKAMGGNTTNEAFERGYNAASEEERRDIAIELATAGDENREERQAAMDGARQKIEDDADMLAAERRELYNQVKHTDGTLRPVVMKEKDEAGNDKTAYLVEGNVVMTADGTMVDREASEASVVIYDPATGRRVMIDPAGSLGVHSVGKVTTAEEYEAETERRRQEYIQQQLDAVNGTVRLKEGDEYTMPDGSVATVVANDGETVTLQLADGTQTQMPLAEVQRIADELALADWQQRHPEESAEAAPPATEQPEEAMEQPASVSEGHVAGVPEAFVPGMEIVVADEEGEKEAMVLGTVRYEGGRFVPDENGAIVEYMVDGRVKHEHVGDLQGKTVSWRDETAVQSESATAEAAATQQIEQPLTGEQPTETAEPTAATEAMPMRADGEPDFMATTPERGHRYIYEEAGLSREEAGQFVKANIDEAAKALKKLQGKAPKMGTSLAKYQQEKAAHQQQVDEAQAVLDYWNGVKAVEQGILATETAERVERDRIAHEEAVAAEAARQAEEIAKQQEEAERGANAVHPAIRERWEKAPKVEGNGNMITLPSGERIRGRYVLVESGAATPSHNPNNEFARNEGFPVDENGQTVNDRDYERDREAQQITRNMSADYDARAAQSVPVVSRDGVVLSGNGRTMAGELAAQQGTDVTYLDYLKEYPQQFGFTREQVEGMQHPRVVFVPDEAMPYTTETFAKFNAQDMKSQSRTEQAVKLGKTVDDNTFGRIVRSINKFDTLGDFYNDPKAPIDAIGELHKAGAINQMQLAEMMDGEKISGVGRQMLENMLIGKAFESNPDAVRQLAEYPNMRQSVVSALAEVTNNIRLGADYSLEGELSQAIDLAYNARKSGIGAGEPVSAFARQTNLFAFDEGETVADYTNACILMLADCMNDSRVSQLKKVLAIYNDRSAQSAAGQYDIFSGGVKSKEEILKDVSDTLNYGTKQEQKAALAGAAERRKEAASVSEDGTVGGGDAGSEQPATNDRKGSDGSVAEGGESEEIDENGYAFVKAEDGTTVFGEVREESGLPAAPIKLSEGYQDRNGKGYGLAHIEANHGKQIREAGFATVEDFVRFVAQNYDEDNIRVGKHRVNGSTSYLIQVTDEHDNTLFIELSKDGTYWNVNSGGIFRKGYSNKKETVTKTEPQQPGNARGDSSLSAGEEGGITPTEPNGKSSVSGGKGTTNSETEQEKVVNGSLSEGAEVSAPVGQPQSNRPANQKAEGEGVSPVGEVSKAVRDAAVETMKDMGIDVSMDAEEGQRVLDMVNGTATMSRGKRKTASETASISENQKHRRTVVSSADGAKKKSPEAVSSLDNQGHQQTVVSSDDGAKILNNLDTLSKKIKNLHHSTVKTFIGDVAKAIGARRYGSKSQYATFETVNSQEVTIRLADHNSTVSGFDHEGHDNGISIVISPKKSEGINNDGKAHIVEFYYDAIRLRRADGEPLAAIVDSLKQALYSGEYKDTTGLAVRQEVNADDVRQMKAFHGSGADFDVFDHSHMGEGEGAQAYGWGSYVTGVEGIGRTYAEQDNRKDKAYRAARFARSAYDRTVWDMQHASTKEEKVALREKAKAQKEKYDKKLQEWRDMEDNHFLYTVEIPDDNGRDYLRWDKPMTDEQAGVIGSMLDNEHLAEFEKYYKGKNGSANATGQRVYWYLADYYGDEMQASKALSEHFTGIKYPTDYSRDSSDKGTYNYVIFDESDLKITDKAKFFRTQDGVAYGFTLGGKVYIDPRIATSETPVHEYMHLWAQGVRRTNPKAWEDIKRAFAADANLVDWVRRRYPEIEDEDTLMEEVFAHYSGRRGAERLEADMKAAMEAEPDLTMKARVATVFHKLRELLNRFWDVARDMFAGKNVNLRKMSKEDIADMAVGDLLGGFNPNRTRPEGRGAEQPLRMQNDAERAAIVERAKADGTYMKAPNGKPTKLSERQWVEVRTKAFKEWFGDWEKAARIEKLRGSESVEITGQEVQPSDDLKEYRKNALEYGKGIRGKYHNLDRDLDIEVYADNIKEVLHHDYKDVEHLQSVAAIPQLIEKGIYITTEANAGNKDIDSFDYYVSGLKIGGEDYTVKFVVSNKKDGTRYYDHKLTQIEKGKLLDLSAVSSTESASSFLNENVKDKRLLSILENNSSKIVDENGEPLVVYHGTKYGGFTKFKDGFIYFADEDTAQSYATYYDDWTDAPIIRNYEDDYDGDGRNLYAAFLNIHNPLTYDYQNTGALDGYDGLESPSYYAENMPNVNDGLVLLNIKDLSEFMGGAAEFDEDGQPIGDYSDNAVYVVRHPNQIKSATDNIGTYDGGNVDIRYSAAGDVFYSNAERAVEGVKQEKATAEQWKAMVTKAGGLKAGEDKWLGLGDWLEERKGQMLTKQEVLDYIAQNQIRIAESYYAKEQIFSENSKRNLESELKKRGDDSIESILEAWDRAFNDSKLEQYRQGRFIVNENNEIETGEQLAMPINATRLDYTTEGLENKREIALTVPTVEPWHEADEVHFGDAGGGRAVCWVRFGEARDADGKRVLVIDEIQSKRHQEGREKGYSNQAVVDEYNNAQNARLGIRKFIISKYEDFDGGTSDEEILSNENVSEEDKADLRAAINDYEKAIEAYKKVGEVPDAPFEKNWHEVAMKRMLRYAAENGFDKVAWTTGEQQAERYNIGQSVKSIEKEDDYSFRVNKPDGGYMTLDFDEDGVYRDEADADLDGKTMADVFGKELASRLQGAEVGSTVEGEGLRIGGEGMKGFYDRMLPQFMDKYGKKWGVKSGEVELELPNEADRVMHAVEVTEEMKRSVMEGQPMFQKGEEKNAEVKDQVLSEFNEAKVGEARGRVIPIGELTRDGREVLERISGLQMKPSIRFVLNASDLRHIYNEHYGNNEKDTGNNIPLTDADIRALVDVITEPDDIIYGEEIKGGRKLFFFLKDAGGGAYNLTEVYADSKGNLTAKSFYKTKKGSNLRANELKNSSRLSTSKTSGASLNSGAKIPQIFETAKNNLQEVDSERRREGEEEEWEPLTYEESLRRSKAAGYTKKQHDEWMARNERNGRQAVADLIEKMGLGGRVEIHEDGSGLTGRKARAKGWFDPKTGKIHIVLGNHRYWADTLKTLLHEGVAHYGLRELMGEHFDEFLDTVYSDAEEGIRRKIAEMAARNGWDFRTATEEYMAKLAEEMDFENAEQETWFGKVKTAFTRMLRKLGAIFRGVTLTDNELKYLLWRSWKNLTEKGRYRSLVDIAEDVAMQDRLGVLDSDQTRARRWVELRGKAMDGVEWTASERAEYEELARDLYGDGEWPGESNQYNILLEKWRQRELNDSEYKLMKELEGELMQEAERKALAERETRPDIRASKRPNGSLSIAAEDRVLFRDEDFTERDRAVVREEYERMVQSGSYQFREAMQDSMLGLRKAYESILGKGTKIEDVAGNENAYLAENRMSSVNAAEQANYFREVMTPLLKAVHDIAGNSKEERAALTDYLMAKHGLERNEKFAERDFNEYQAQHPTGSKTLADFRQKDYSGLTALTGNAYTAAAEAVARQMVAGFETAHDTTELWEKINDATKTTLAKVYQSGMVSEESYEQIRDMFDYYIPLRGWDETTSDEVYGYLTSKDGPLRGSTIKHAYGRSSKADDPIATIGLMADTAIRQGNRNEMKQRFLTFALNHPSDLVSVSKLWLHHDAAADEWVPVFADIEADDPAYEVERKVKEFEKRMEQLAEADPDNYKSGRDAANIPYKVVKDNISEHQVLVKRGGETFVLTINGNPRAAQALNGLTNPDVETSGVIGNMLKGAEYINRQLSAFYTTRTPDFVVSNFMRDMLYSNCMTWVKENPRYALTFHKNFGKVNPTTMRVLFGKWEKGTLDEGKELERQFKRFMLNGGETGYTNVKDIEGHKRAIAAELRRQGSAAAKAWNILGMQLDLLNRSVENCARFAAFLTSQEMGRSLERSIYDAKEVSVNFNKKGSGGKMVNATGQTRLGKIGSYMSGGGRLLYVFWNAGVQGMTNFGRAAKRHPGKFAAGAASMFALGAVIPLLAQLLGGDDDDDKNAYYNLPEYTRRSNICFRAGEQWVTIPLPIEFRAIYGLGELATGVITGEEHYSDGELARQMTSQVSQILPLDFMEGSGGLHAFIPSVAKPLVEAAGNKGWTGLPIYKDNPWNQNDPEFTKVYKSADKHIVAASKWLNELTGGDDYKKGWADVVNPAQVEYLLNGYFGGYFKVPTQLMKMAGTAAGSREFEWRNMMIANRLIKSGDERTANRKLRDEYYKYEKEYEETKRLKKKYEKAAQESLVGYAEKVNLLNNSEEYGRYLIFDQYRKEINRLYKAQKEEADGEVRKQLEEEYYEEMRQMVDAMHEYENGEKGQ